MENFWINPIFSPIKAIDRTLICFESKVNRGSGVFLSSWTFPVPRFTISTIESKSSSKVSFSRIKKSLVCTWNAYSKFTRVIPLANYYFSWWPNNSHKILFGAKRLKINRFSKLLLWRLN